MHTFDIVLKKHFLSVNRCDSVIYGTILIMRSKLKWGPTIQQIDSVIYVVNLGAEAKRFTHRRCKVLTLSIPQEGEWGGNLPKKGCATSAKSRPGKNHKISVQMMLSIRIDKCM